MRVLVNVINKTLYNNFFGMIVDPYNLISIESNERLSIWCVKIDRTLDGCYWAVAANSDPVWVCLKL